MAAVVVTIVVVIFLGVSILPGVIAVIAEKIAAYDRAAEAVVRETSAENDGYTPNWVPIKTRIWNASRSVVLLLYGSIGLYLNDIYIPGKRQSGIHFHDGSALILYGAMLCAALNLLVVVADHYDRRNNEINYKNFARITQCLGWGLFVAALVVGLVWGQTNARHH